MDLHERPPEPDAEEFITLIGADMDEIHAAYQAQGLAERHYYIVQPAGRHRFARADCEVFDGRTMIAATFRRQRPA